jgi:serine/threonine protein kinase
MKAKATNNQLIGTKIGSFKVLEELGEGAYGTVFKGVHPTIGRMVAIKVLNKAFSSDESIVNRFIDEARSANSINHPNIVQIFDFGQLDDGRFFCIMEYINGKELNMIIDERCGLEMRYIEIILPQLISALSAAHDSGVIHRDLKPDNIMVFRGREGIKIKILDFGIAKLLENNEEAKEHKTKMGDIMGTPAYMAPEQARGQTDKIDSRTDIYSMGVILYQMLSNKLPIEGRSIPDLLIKLLNDPPIPLVDAAPDMSQSISDFLGKVLSKNQIDRPPTMEEFFKDFEAAVYDDPMYAETAIDESPSEITQVPYFTEEENGYDEEIFAEYRRKSEGASSVDDYSELYSSQIIEDRKNYVDVNKSGDSHVIGGRYESYRRFVGSNNERNSESLHDLEPLSDPLVESSLTLRRDIGYDDDDSNEEYEQEYSTDGLENALISNSINTQSEKSDSSINESDKNSNVGNILFGVFLIALALGGLYYFMVYKNNNKSGKPSKTLLKKNKNENGNMGAQVVNPMVTPEVVMGSMNLSMVSSMGNIPKNNNPAANCTKVWCMTKQFNHACCCKTHPFETISKAFIRTKMKSIAPSVSACFEKHKYTGIATLHVTLMCNGSIRSIGASTKGGKPSFISCLKRTVRKVNFPKFRKTSLQFNFPFKFSTK